MPSDAQQPRAGCPGTPRRGDDPAGQDQRQEAGGQPQAGAWEGGGQPQRGKDEIYPTSHSATERMEEKNNPRARRLEEMLSGDERHRVVSKQAGKLNWDESPGAGSVHLSHKPRENTLPSSPGCDFQPRPALQKGNKLQNHRFVFCFLPTKDGKVAAGCLSTGVMTNHGLPSGLPGSTGPRASHGAVSGCWAGAGRQQAARGAAASAGWDAESRGNPLCSYVCLGGRRQTAGLNSPPSPMAAVGQGIHWCPGWRCEEQGGDGAAAAKVGRSQCGGTGQCCWGGGVG